MVWSPPSKVVLDHRGRPANRGAELVDVPPPIVRAGETWECRFEPDKIPQLPIWEAAFGSFPIPVGANIWVQGPTGPVANTKYWATWQAPPGATMAFLFCLGSGGTGGGGRNAAQGTASRTGAGGGGGSAFSRMLVPLIFLPPVLHVSVPVGEAGPAQFTAGTAGGVSYVSTYPDIGAIVPSLAFLVTYSGGQASAGSDGGGAGAGGSAAAASSFVVGNFGLFLAIGGPNGAVGGSSAGGAAGSSPGAVFQGSEVCTGGAGGGGAGSSTTANAGGSITTLGNTPAVPGGAGGTGGGVNGTDGGNGYAQERPWCSTGGGGGGSSDAAAAGAGGAGGYGSGGGGGGGGVTGGRGGRAGDGLVMIVAF